MHRRLRRPARALGRFAYRGVGAGAAVLVVGVVLLRRTVARHRGAAAVLGTVAAVLGALTVTCYCRGHRLRRPAPRVVADR